MKMTNARMIAGEICRKNFFRLILLSGISFTFTQAANATATITTATGGTISADKAANASSPSFTTLGNIVVTEGANGDFAIGANVTFILNAPAGWNFNTAASVTSTFTASRNITSASVTSKTTTAITVTLTVTGTNKADILTIGGVQIQATEGGNIPVSGNITKSGTSSITGCATSAVLGSLTQTTGTGRMVISLPGQVLTDAATAAASGISGSVTNQVAGT